MIWPGSSNSCAGRPLFRLNHLKQPPPGIHCNFLCPSVLRSFPSVRPHCTTPPVYFLTFTEALSDHFTLFFAHILPYCVATVYSNSTESPPLKRHLPAIQQCSRQSDRISLHPTQTLAATWDSSPSSRARAVPAIPHRRRPRRRPRRMAQCPLHRPSHAGTMRGPGSRWSQRRCKSC